MAERVALDANKAGVSTFDPATILLIVQVIIAVVDLWKKCKTPENAVAQAMNPGLVGRNLLWLKVRKYMPYEKRQAVYESLLKNGLTLTVDKVQKMYEEVK